MSRATQDAMLRQLKQPFDPKFVKWRVGATNGDKTKGIALAYIDSREVQKRLDDVCGVGGWQDRYIPLEGGFICELDIWIDDRWVTKSNTAGYTHVDPIKGGGSDALKRAASAWGVGRYLYYLPNIWVAVKQTGTTRDGKPIYSLAETPELPEWAKPNTAIERWEDVAEMELDVNSGEDDMNLATVVIETVDLLRAASSEEELDRVLESLTSDQHVLLANEINTKRRALQHEANIHANSGQPSSKK